MTDEFIMNGQDFELTVSKSDLSEVVMYTVLDKIQADPHLWSCRPCPTCGQITAMLGRDFGCVLYKERKYS